MFIKAFGWKGGALLKVILILALLIVFSSKEMVSTLALMQWEGVGKPSPVLNSDGSASVATILSVGSALLYLSLSVNSLLSFEPLSFMMRSWWLQTHIHIYEVDIPVLSAT